MTLAQALDYVRKRHNASSDSNWSDPEIYAIMTARCNEILSIIGLIESLDTSISTVASTQDYAFPSGVVFVKKVLYDGYPTQNISLREAETLKQGNQTPSGRPEAWFEWAKRIYFIPIPNEVKTVTLYAEKEHPLIDNSSQTTIDIPTVLHARMLDGVLSDMYAKDLNSNFMTHYENLWNQKHIPAFHRYKMLLKYRGQIPNVIDPDSNYVTDKGIV